MIGREIGLPGGRRSGVERLESLRPLPKKQVRAGRPEGSLSVTSVIVNFHFC